MLDSGWNYQNNIDLYSKLNKQEYIEMYADVRREEIQIIHYISSDKQWKTNTALDIYYHKYEQEFKKKMHYEKKIY